MEDKKLLLDGLKNRNYEMYKYFERGLEIISILNEKTFEAYIVGGAVRDFVLNLDFKDIDIATNATPVDIKNIFTNFEIDDKYEHLGAVVLKEGNFKFEITTFRNEEYVKYKIKDVHYSKKLVEDIIRRDFTINALAITPNLNIVDLVDGTKDLEHGVVRVIGSGKRRFKDDPTRILRGLHLVSKFGFIVDANTEKGMRKSKIYLKEISEFKILQLMQKIIAEKYGLKALKIIDDNNLFKFLPNYAYWVRLLIGSYKKMTLLEKMTLLYRIMGNIPTNTTHSRDDLEQIKKLFDLSLNIAINKVDSTMVFSYGANNLISADRIAKVYNKKYKKQKRMIKKLNRKLPIRNINEMNFSTRELMDLLNGDNSKVSKIMNELLKMVLNKEVENTSSSLKAAALKLLYAPVPSNEDAVIKEQPLEKKASFSSLFKKKHNQKDERYFDDTHEETKLYKKVYEEYPEDEVPTDFDGWDLIDAEDYYESSSVIENNNVITFTDEELSNLFNEYKDDYIQLCKIYLRGVKDYYELSPNEQKIKSEEIKTQVREFLVNNNPKYKVLSDRGMI